MFRAAGRLGSSTWILGGQTCVAKHVYVIFYFRKIWLDLKLFYVQPIAAGTIHLDELMVQNGRRFVLEINLKLRAATSRNVLPDMCPSEDSDQPAHSHSLTRILSGRIWDSKGCKLFSCGQRRLIRMRSLICLHLAYMSEGTFSLVAALLSHRMSIKPSFII